MAETRRGERNRSGVSLDHQRTSCFVERTIMNIFVTAGNTQTPVDRVRCITNVFTGRTGAHLAMEAHRRGHTVTLLTSHPEAVRDLNPDFVPRGNWVVRPYRTFESLKGPMAELVPGGRFDVLIH